MRRPEFFGNHLQSDHRQTLRTELEHELASRFDWWKFAGYVGTVFLGLGLAWLAWVFA